MWFEKKSKKILWDFLITKQFGYVLKTNNKGEN